MTTKLLAAAAVLLGGAALLGCAASHSRDHNFSREAPPTTTAPAPVEAEADPWNAPLREALAGCDWLGIHTSNKGEPVVVTVEGTARVKRVIDMIRLDPEASGLSWCCEGYVTFTFARHGTHRATLAFIGGLGFRWHDGPWDGDGRLTKTSSLAVSRWLAERGAPQCLEELRASAMPRH